MNSHLPRSNMCLQIRSQNFYSMINQGDLPLTEFRHKDIVTKIDAYRGVRLK